jgi:Putative beta-barrel porin-2, OmpL-like. bbp2
LLQQNWLRLERPVVKTGTTEPTFGFRNDWILPGSDYRFTLPRGIFNGQLTGDNGQPNRYGIDPIQFYAEAYFPTVGAGLDVKFGRIFCQYGVEANDAPSNYLLSHAYTFIYDPFTHTGLMGTLNLTDTWSVQAGVMLGSDIFIDPADTPTGMGSVKWAPPGGRDSVLFSVILGPGRFNQGRNFHNPEVFDLVYTHKFDARLSYNLEVLYGFTYNVPDTGFANWLGVLNYLIYDFTPRLSGTVRLEFFDDAQGQRTGFEGLYSALTAGLSFKPRKDIIIRPELRYDYNADSRPFENKHGLFTAATDVILRW